MVEEEDEDDCTYTYDGIAVSGIISKEAGFANPFVVNNLFSKVRNNQMYYS